jgi:hypothetical protein
MLPTTNNEAPSASNFFATMIFSSTESRGKLS